jgi:hypothetical protein
MSQDDEEGVGGSNDEGSESHYHNRDGEGNVGGSDNVTQRRTKAGYDFYMKSLERTKLQCERGIQAARDGQLLAPPTVGKYTYHHRLFLEYEEILIQEHDK